VEAVQLSEAAFLDSVSNPSTRKNYRIGLKKFCEWYGKTPEAILKERMDDITGTPGDNVVERKFRDSRFERVIETYHTYLTRDKGYSANSARTYTGGIRQLFRYYKMPIHLRRGSKVNKGETTTKSFPLTMDHVRRMYHVGSLKDRVLLSLATDLGLRISDFRALQTADLPALTQEPPIPFLVHTRKEGVVAHCFLSGESVDSLKTYLPTINNDHNPYLFFKSGVDPISEDSINRWLKTLARHANITIPEGKSLSFHCFRKLFFSTATNVGVPTAAKKIIGKTIPPSDDTYLTTLKLRNAFRKVKKELEIHRTTSQDDDVERYEETIFRQEKDLGYLKKKLEAVTNEYARRIEELERGLDDKVRTLIIEKLEELAHQSENVTLYLPSHEEPTTRLKGILIKITPKTKG
jgi:integrase